MADQKKRISELPESQSTQGLYTIGVNAQNKSVKVPIGSIIDEKFVDARRLIILHVVTDDEVTMSGSESPSFTGVIRWHSGLKLPVIVQNPAPIGSKRLAQRTWAANNSDIKISDTQLVSGGYIVAADKSLWRGYDGIWGKADADTKEYYKPTRIEKIADYAYHIWYGGVDYADAAEYFKGNYEAAVGACSAIWKDGVLYRNYDWYYSNNAGFFVHTPAVSGRHAVNGFAGYLKGLTMAVVDSGEWNDKYRILPYLMTDGMNDAGLTAAVLVCENKDVTPTAQNTGKKKMNGLFIVRYVLDNHTDALEAAQDIANNYDVYMPHTDSVDEELHFIIGDKEKCVILEFVENETKIIQDRNFVTNFKLHGTTNNEDGTIDYTTVHRYGQGVERYNIIAKSYKTSLSAVILLPLRYTNAYQIIYEGSWRTEFTGIENNLTVQAAFDTPEIYDGILAAARTAYLERNRDEEKTWQTCHSVIFDSNTKKINFFVQEDHHQGWTYDTTSPGLEDEIAAREAADAALWAAVNDKVDKVAGKGLSTNDYTYEEKLKVANAATLDQAKGIGVMANQYTAKRINLAGENVLAQLNELLNGVGETTTLNQELNGILAVGIGGFTMSVHNIQLNAASQKYIQLAVTPLGISDDGQSLDWGIENSNECVLVRRRDSNGWQPWKPLHQEIVGKLGDLTTTDKSSIVAAINEASGNNKKILFGRNMYPEEFAFRDGSHVLDASGNWKTGSSTFIFKITRKHDRVHETYGRAFICDGWNEVGLTNPVAFSKSKELTDGDVGKYVAVCHTSGYNGPMYSVYSENVWFEDLLSEKEYKNELDKIHALYRPNEYKFNALNSTTNTIYVSPLKLMHGNNIRNIMSGCDDELGNMAWPYMISTAKKLEYANQCNLLLREFRANYPITGVTSLYNCFGGCVYLESLNLSGWDTSAVTTMQSMFYGCSALTSLDLSGWDTSAVTTMYYMFYGCSALTSLDLSGWDTSAVTTMYYMFGGCSALTSLDLSGWDTSAVTTMQSMFGGCSSLTSLDLSGWDTSAVTTMQSMFGGCSALTSLDLSGWVTSAVTTMYYMFGGCSSLTSLDLSGWDTSAVTTMYYMFYGCSALTSLDLSGWDTSAVTTMYYMFGGCSALTSLDLSGWDTSAVTTMQSMFGGCSSLTSLDLSGWDTSAVTTMQSMFYGCSALTSLDLSGWVTSAVTTMYYMFYGCSSLTSLDLSGWVTSAVTTMQSMFYGCSALTSLDLSGWDTSAVTTMQSMFYGCSALTSLIGGSQDTTKTCLNGLTANLNMSGTNIDRASILAVFNGLADMSGQTAPTITLGNTLKAKLTNEDKAIAIAKNWNIA